MYSKGRLSVMLHITRLALDKGLPLDQETLRTPKTGQVAGLGKKRIQSILNDHGITHVLAQEGGRTSRGSLDYASQYAVFLNSLHEKNIAELHEIEKWWVKQVQNFFSGQPFKLKFDAGRSLRSIVTDLLDQAAKRQKENPGTTYAGTVLQHLVGAKLDLILAGKREIAHQGANVADAATVRQGDFVLDGISVHVTTAPSEALVRKCIANIDAGIRPVVVTIADSRAGFESLAKNFNVVERVDVFEAEQFIATNILEWSGFQEKQQRDEVKKLIDRYNAVVRQFETDPSLTIEYDRPKT